MSMNEPSDERLGRTLDQIAKLALLNDAALVQEDDRIAKERRFAKVMGHEHHGFRQTAEYALEFALAARRGSWDRARPMVRP